MLKWIIKARNFTRYSAEDSSSYWKHLVGLAAAVFLFVQGGSVVEMSSEPTTQVAKKSADLGMQILASQNVRLAPPIRSDLKRDCGANFAFPKYRLDRGKAEVKLRVDAGNYWNAWRVQLEKDAVYDITVNGDTPTWRDKNEISPPTGWGDKATGITKFFIGGTKFLRRDPTQNLFHLMGAVYGNCVNGRQCAKQFQIGLGRKFKSPITGEFCAFANDVPIFYGNNSGHLEITVRRNFPEIGNSR